MADYSEAYLLPTYGMYALPYAATWPDLAAQLTQLYNDRTAPISWLPPGWLSGVMSLHNQNGYILVPAPGTVTPPIPWLQTDGQIQWWTDFNQRANAVITAYAADQAAQGAILLAQLYADAAFWNEAYEIATFLATPVTIVEDVASGAASAAATAGSVINAMGAFSTPIILGCVGLAAYFVFFHHPTVRLLKNPRKRR